MHLSPILRHGLLAAAALFTSQVHAALVADANAIYIGFRATGGQGSDTSYILKLGVANVTNFPQVATSPTVISGLGDVGADLQFKYGSTWYSRSDLFWGIFGNNTGANPTIYGSRARGADPSVRTDPWANPTQTERGITDTQINSVLASYALGNATANSPVATFQLNDASAASSYAKQVGTAGSKDFGSGSTWDDIEGSFASGSANAVLDLYRSSGSTGTTYRGTFTITDTGIVSYSFLPVPEPSVSLLLVVAGAATCGLRRKRLAAQP